jgi:DNA repair protein RecN (Recombination protein N)
MLSRIHINNFTIIDDLDLEFQPGFTVLTGETGAGKSIILDALGLALGDRADSQLIRDGQQRADVTVEFDVADSSAASRWLQEHDLDSDGECQIRRAVTREGRSRAYINNLPVPVQSLKQLGELLIDIHGQHEHQSLTRRDIQQQILDETGGLSSQAKRVSDLFYNWKDVRQELTRLSGSHEEKLARQELLAYQVNELSTLAPREKELEGLEDEQTRLAHAEQLLQSSQSLLGEIADDEFSLVNRLNRLLAELQAAGKLDPRLGNIAEYVNTAQIHLEEAHNELRHYAERIELDPDKLNEVEQRLGLFHDLARKHHVNPAELPSLLMQLENELAGIEHSEADIAALEQQLIELEIRYREEAEKLSRQRDKAAKKLSKAITAVMQDLGMPGGQLVIQLTPNEPDTPAAAGLEHANFLVSTNPGNAPKPLAKVASGGELSRISLAIQVIATTGTHIPSLVFDEVDTGVGGGIAEVIGQKLRALGGRAGPPAFESHQTKQQEKDSHANQPAAKERTQ